MKCKVLSSTIVYDNEYFKPGAIFDAKDEDVKGLVEGGFIEVMEVPKEAEVTEEPAENKEPETGEEALKAEEKPAENKEPETVKEAPEAEEKPAKEPKPRGERRK